MTGAPAPGARDRAARAGPVVQARLIGDPAALDALAAALDHAPGIDVLGTSGPRPNRYDPGVRVYLTICVRKEAVG